MQFKKGDVVIHNAYGQCIVNGYPYKGTVSVTFDNDMHGIDAFFKDIYTGEIVYPKKDYSWNANESNLTLKEENTLNIDFKVGYKVNTKHGTGIIIGIRSGNVDKDCVYAVEHDTWKFGHAGNGFTDKETEKLITGKSVWYYFKKDLTLIKGKDDVKMTNVSVNDIVKTSEVVELGDGLAIMAGIEGKVVRMCFCGLHPTVDFGGAIGERRINVKSLSLVKSFDPFESVKDVDYTETEKITEFDARFVYDEDGKITDGRTKLVEREWTFIFKKNIITAKLVVDGKTYTGVAEWDGTGKYLKGRLKELATVRARKAYFEALEKEIENRK